MANVPDLARGWLGRPICCPAGAPGDFPAPECPLFGPYLRSGNAQIVGHQSRKSDPVNRCLTCSFFVLAAGSDHHPAAPNNRSPSFHIDPALTFGNSRILPAPLFAPSPLFRALTAHSFLAHFRRLAPSPHLSRRPPPYRCCPRRSPAFVPVRFPLCLAFALWAVAITLPSPRPAPAPLTSSLPPAVSPFFLSFTLASIVP
ncbi:hypothetical protein DFH06DRAFT_1317067 [Mycena polygramma]|nr:hypothetical protein DFH06DRAFT_1317067 [Mycena polygramma]